MKKYNADNDVKTIDVSELYATEFWGCPNEGAYCSPYTLLRLFADKIPEIPDKILYLDADIMFNRDFTLLYDIDVSGWSMPRLATITENTFCITTISMRACCF